MPASGTVPNLELPTPCPVLVYTSQDVENPVLRLGSRDMEKALLHAERALQHAWTTITRVPSHLAQIQIRDDTKVALVVGLVLGVVIIVLLNKFPGEPFDYSTTAEEEPNKEQQASSETLVGDVTTISGSDAQSVDDILKDEERLLANQRLGRATKMLGLTDDQVRQAIRQARSELQSGKTGAAAEYEYGSISAKVDVVFYVVAFGALFYFLNRDYGGLATEWVRHIFPREADLLFGPRSDL